MKELAGAGLVLLWGLFMVLRMTEVVTWPWYVVFSPLWIPTALALLGSALALLWVLGGILVRKIT